MAQTKVLDADGLAQYDAVSRATSNELYVPKGGKITVTTSKIGKIATITITEDNVEHTISVSDGENGVDAITFTPSVADDGTLSWSNSKGVANPASVNIKGVPGKDGAKGATFTPSVNATGVLSWTNDRGLSNPSPVSIKGTTGSNGTTFTPSVSSAGVLSWSNDGGKANPASVSIKGADGVWEGVTTHEMSATNTSVTLLPNEDYFFPTMSSLTITLGISSKKSDEYTFQFTSGSTATILSIPSSVKTPDGFEIEANKVYEISIKNNILLCSSVPA